MKFLIPLTASVTAFGVALAIPSVSAQMTPADTETGAPAPTRHAARIT